MKDEKPTEDVVTIPAWAFQLQNQIAKLQIENTMLRGFIEGMRIRRELNPEAMVKALNDWALMTEQLDRP